MNGLTRFFWAALSAFCSWRAERVDRASLIRLGEAKEATLRSTWWAERARECDRRARGEAEVRR